MVNPPTERCDMKKKNVASGLVGAVAGGAIMMAVAGGMPDPTISVIPEDVNLDGHVDIFDLLEVRSQLGEDWELRIGRDPRSDIDGDGDVNEKDLAILQGCFSEAILNTESRCFPSDLNYDKRVDEVDEEILLGCFGADDAACETDWLLVVGDFRMKKGGSVNVLDARVESNCYIGPCFDVVQKLTGEWDVFSSRGYFFIGVPKGRESMGKKLILDVEVEW